MALFKKLSSQSGIFSAESVMMKIKIGVNQAEEEIGGPSLPSASQTEVLF